MRHPVEIFDNELLRLMGEALKAALATVRLTGTDPSTGAHLAMARRIIDQASRGGCTRLVLTEAALDGAWH